MAGEGGIDDHVLDLAVKVGGLTVEVGALKEGLIAHGRESRASIEKLEGAVTKLQSSIETRVKTLEDEKQERIGAFKLTEWFANSGAKYFSFLGLFIMVLFLYYKAKPFG